MKYIGAKNGKISIFEKDEPILRERFVKIKTLYSAISPGTEISMAEGSKEHEFALGYSALGEVIELADGVEGLAVGDIVATYGAPYTGHHEILAVPQTLVNKVPNNVDLRDASMSGLGSIAIHALRQANLQFGEIVVVVGLGIYGQLISQIAENAGLLVLPLNRSSQRAEMLQDISGIESFSDEKELEEKLDSVSNGMGADAVFLCVGGDSSYLCDKSLEWLRPGGKSVIVGDIKPNYDRSLMFAKEAEILISRAGGPGRYDANYELNAIDYPYQYVRWTEGRNAKEYLRLLENKRIKVSDYYNETYALEEYEEAYASFNVRGADYLSQIFDYRKRVEK